MSQHAQETTGANAGTGGAGGQLTRRRMVAWACGTGGALAAAAAVRGTELPRVAAQQQASIVGTWLSTRGQETDLITFIPGGSLIGSSPPLRPAPPDAPSRAGSRTAAHGSWTSMDGQTFAYTLVVIEYDQQVQFQGMTKASGTVTLDVSGDSGNGPYALTVTDASGGTVFMDRGRLQLSRAKVDAAS